MHCPCHDDRNPSLSLSEAADGKVLLHDQAGCSQEAVIEALLEQGLWPKPRANGRRPVPQIVATFDYEDERGRLLFQTVRLDPKDFRQRRPDGAGGWAWNIKGVQRVPYRLPELIAADRGEPVFVVEGEKHVDALRDIGFVATTSPMGAGKWLDSYAGYFRDRHVVILPDNDDPGRDHAQKVARSVDGVASSVKVGELADLPWAGDVLDWLQAGGTKEDLVALAEAAPLWEVDDASAPLKAEPLEELLAREDESLDPVITDGGEGAVLTRDGKGCVAAAAGVGKTNMLLRLSRQVCTGQTFLGYRIPKPRSVLYLMLEGSPRATKRRLRKVWQGTDAEARGRFHIGHVTLDLSDEHSLLALYALLSRVQPEVLVIDPLRNAHPWDENVSHEMKRLTTILDDIITRYGCAVLLAHHNRKRPPFVRRDVGADRLRGSTAFTGWLSFALSLDPDPSVEDRLVAEWVKTRDAEAPLERLSLDFDRETLDFIPADREPEGKVSDDAILNAVFHQGGTARGPELVQGFVEGAGASERWVRERIRALVKDGRIEEYIADLDRRSGAKTYRLPGESLSQENDG